MADLPKAEEIVALVSALAPGILILGVRTRFRDAAPPDMGGRLLSYALVSIVYGVVAYPAFHDKTGTSLSPWLWTALLTLVVPIVTGLGLAFFDSSDKFYAVAEWAGLKPAHHTPTAWDYAFPRTGRRYILVHLNDGATIAGVWEKGSFSSSISSERDIYISRLCKTDEATGAWESVDPPRSILISHGNIQMVEFIEGTRNG